MAASSNNERVVRRLQHDMRELQREQVPGLVEAVPEGNGSNLFVWNVKMRAACGPLEGKEIRMCLTMPPDYPSSPPDVRLLTPLPDHPNVFGDWICLDMIKDPEWNAAPYKGWSASYTLVAVLRGLYGFLLVDDSVDQMYGGPARHRFGIARREQAPPPAAQQLGLWMGARQQQGGRALATAPEVAAVAMAPADSHLELLDAHLLGRVLEDLPAQDLWRCCATGSARLRQHARDALQRQELVCFHSKATFKEAVLGFGVYREWHGGRPGQAGGSLKEAVVRLDYLSLDAFVHAKVTRSAWNAPMDAFLPLYLNPEHGERSLRALPACLNHLGASHGQLPATVLSPAGPGVAMDPRRLLTVLAQAVKSLVVEVVKLEDPSAAGSGRRRQEEEEEPHGAPGNVPTHMSDAALHGFAHLHHLLLAVALAPGGERLLSMARQDLEAFCSQPAARHKNRCPDLGVLLVELLLVPKEAVPWSRLMPALLRECLARHVRWIVKDVGPRFGQVAQEDLAGTSEHTYERMQTHFLKASTGMRTVLLMCWFSNELARPDTVAGAAQELAAIKRAYDATSGLPPPRAGARFHAFAREAICTGSWVAFLAAMRVALLAVPGCDARAMWGRTLRQAVVDSWVQGYHALPVPWAHGTYRKLTPLPRLPPPPPPATLARAAPEALEGPGPTGGQGPSPGKMEVEVATVEVRLKRQKLVDWSEVAKTLADKPAAAAVVVGPRAPVDTAWPWSPVDKLRREAQEALGCPFVDWAAQPPARAVEGPDAW